MRGIVVEERAPAKAGLLRKERLLGPHVSRVRLVEASDWGFFSRTYFSTRIGASSGAYTSTLLPMTPADNRRKR
jgi:hypothetical protein